MTELREPESPPRDSSTEERLALIAEGATLTLEQAVRELLDVADDAMRSSSGVKRPDEAHGGAYLSRWRFARLRNALVARPPEEPLAELRRFADGDTRPVAQTYMTAGAAPLRGPSPAATQHAVECAARMSETGNDDCICGYVNGVDVEAVRWAVALLEIHEGVKANPNSQYWLERLREVARVDGGVVSPPEPMCNFHRYAITEVCLDCKALRGVSAPAPSGPQDTKRATG